MSNHVFREVAQHLQVDFLAGEIDREQVTSILTTLACALTDEGWYAESVDHSMREFHDWPIIVKALKTALGT
jgi:hypothetical protein